MTDRVESKTYPVTGQTSQAAGQTRTEAGAARRRRAALGNRPRILIVDDNEDSRLALRALLESLDYPVFEARDGMEAIARARELRPDLVFMDIMMPRMDGLEATRRIRALPELDGVRIVCLSAMEGAVEASAEAGCDDCVVKPIYDLTAFGQQVAHWLDLEDPA